MRGHTLMTRHPLTIEIDNTSGFTWDPPRCQKLRAQSLVSKGFFSSDVSDIKLTGEFPHTSE